MTFRDMAIRCTLALHQHGPDVVRHVVWWPAFAFGLSRAPVMPKALEHVKWAEDLGNITADVVASKFDRASLYLFSVACQVPEDS